MRQIGVDCVAELLEVRGLEALGRREERGVLGLDRMPRQDRDPGDDVGQERRVDGLQDDVDCAGVDDAGLLEGGRVPGAVHLLEHRPQEQVVRVRDVVRRQRDPIVEGRRDDAAAEDGPVALGQARAVGQVRHGSERRVVPVQAAVHDARESDLKGPGLRGVGRVPEAVLRIGPAVRVQLRVPSERQRVGVRRRRAGRRGRGPTLPAARR